MSNPTETSSLWKHRDFIKLWGTQTTSAIGSRVSFLALPLTAVLILQATPAQMGYLSAVGALPGLLFGLFIGVWVDQRKRRPLLVLADVGRGLLLLVIPLAAWLGFLHITVLYAILFSTGTLSRLFDAAYHAYLPSMVQRKQLVDANSKLELSRSAAEIAGPSLGGWLVQVITAPVAILVDSCSFFLSAFFLRTIRQPESAPILADKDEPWLPQLWAGVRLLMENRMLLLITVSTAIAIFFNAALEALYLLYMSDNLELSSSLIGIIFGTGSVGFVVGALLPNRLTKRFGLGPTLIAGMIILAASDFVLPLAAGPKPVIVLLLIASQIFFGLGLTLFNFTFR